MRFRRVKGQCDLYYDKRTKTFYLIVVVDAAAEESQYDHVVDVLGVDMGIENIATDSDNQIFESSKVEQIIRKRYARLRSRLQHVGTKSAKLRKLSGKERRFFKKDVNHVISKNIVEKAKGTTRGIGLEGRPKKYTL